MRQILLLISLITLLPVAQAANSPFYLGLKAGLVDSSSASTDPAINAAIDIGYTHNRNLSTEFEISRTIIDGENAGGNNWTADSWSIFAALRTSGSTKLKIKLGLTDLENNDGLEIAAGLGVSYWALGGMAEIEYTRLDDGVSFISFGVNYFY